MWIECANERSIHFRDAECCGTWEEQAVLDDEGEPTGETAPVCVDPGEPIYFNGNNRAEVDGGVGKALIAKYPHAFKRVQNAGPVPGQVPLREFLDRQPADEPPEEPADEPEGPAEPADEQPASEPAAEPEGG